MRKSIVPLLALLMLSAVPAKAWTVTVHNCSNDSLVVRSYDQGDVLRVVANSTITVGGRTSGSIGCVGATYCYLEVQYGSTVRPVPVAGNSVYVRKLESNTSVIIDLPSNC